MLQVTLAGSGYDTLLAVYTGTAVNSLTLVSSNDNCASGLMTSCATFSVTAGTTYSVQVDGAGGAKGAVSIGVTFMVPAPPNDLFSAAVTTFPATGSTLGATLETGEPLVRTGASGSVWYRFTASVGSTTATVRTNDSISCRYGDEYCLLSCVWACALRPVPLCV